MNVEARLVARLRIYRDEGPTSMRRLHLGAEAVALYGYGRLGL